MTTGRGATLPTVAVLVATGAREGVTLDAWADGVVLRVGRDGVGELAATLADVGGAVMDDRTTIGLGSGSVVVGAGVGVDPEHAVRAATTRVSTSD